MGYEDAPATRLLATRCALCGRPLVDSVSVEIGIGPDCRRKVKFDNAISEEVRSEANRLVYEIALHRSTATVDPKVVSRVALRLRDLGLTTLAERMIRGFATIEIKIEGGKLVVDAPYRLEAIGAWHKIPGRIWDSKLKKNTVPCGESRALWNLLRNFYPNSLGIGPKGVFSTGA